VTVHNLPDLDDLQLFVTVIHAGSMGRAAKELGLSPSAVSKRLAVLEARLGVVLVRRTTRQLSLTEAGEAAFRWAEHLLAAAGAMAQELAPGGALRGLLRVSSSSGFGRNHVARVVSEFAAQHPEVEVRLEALDRPVDPAAEGIDVDIRVGGMREPHL
jgi:LysR family transcriptional activator of dmlA